MRIIAALLLILFASTAFAGPPKPTPSMPKAPKSLTSTVEAPGAGDLPTLGEDEMEYVIAMVKWIIAQWEAGNYEAFLSAVILLIVVMVKRFFRKKLRMAWMPFVAMLIGIFGPLSFLLILPEGAALTAKKAVTIGLPSALVGAGGWKVFLNAVVQRCQRLLAKAPEEVAKTEDIVAEDLAAASEDETVSVPALSRSEKPADS